jgi:hypothetical protein
MPWGGVRPGSGRPEGSRAQRVAKLAIEVATAGIQPIEVVLSVMRHAWEQQDYKTAAEMAEVALPYTTPRLASTTVMHTPAAEAAQRAAIGQPPLFVGPVAA